MVLKKVTTKDILDKNGNVISSNIVSTKIIKHSISKNYIKIKEDYFLSSFSMNIFRLLINLSSLGVYSKALSTNNIA